MENDSNHEVESLLWYHPTLNRHTAESMLMHNGMDGTYLLRPSSKGTGEYALSVKCEQAVKHFKIVWMDSNITFGQCTFKSVAEFVEHFRNKPLLSGESGQVVLLKIPYPRDIDEPDTYESVLLHAEFSTAEDSDVSNVDFSVNSKEGFLTKLGGHFKTWRMRWFVLQHNELKYYKQSSSKVHIRTLDLSDCKGCSQDFSQKDRHYVFKLDMGWRVFLMSSASEQDMNDWIKSINWRLKANGTKGSHIFNRHSTSY
uniref:Dual adapter for phosphotyrosine and 3-phosphotyrosine and 3-phosphoinositide n=1 Tax=Arion vulgaris TaxID=1028688 RepID=A0A0B7AGP9_9EUPU